jgi:eukaryotic-like serine/threonine-protein kinase
MNQTHAQSGTGVCPPRDDLAAFNRGELPDSSLEALANHVSDCTECASTLESLRGEDTGGAGLREALQGPPVAEPGFEALEARVRGMVPDLSVTAVKRAGPTAEAPRPSDAEWPLPWSFGGYELLEKLGRGGVGVVYKARQLGLNRLVALKQLRAGPYAEPEERARFRTEGEALARVRHPNVVQVYEVGDYAGQPYLSMELVGGGSLARRLAGAPLPAGEAARVVEAVARAVQAIHRAGVVHRDLKPGNVLLEADGTAKVSDFGLAKLLDVESEHTHTGAILGTASYMAPEQAEGRSRHVGPTTDVWALGAILYECLTGHRPFQGASRAATLEQVRHREPPRPRHWRPVSRDLEAVCLKCLEKEPTQRYPSAEALADDLGRWLEGKPTRVRPLGWAGRAKRALARHPWRGAAAALCLLAALGAGAGWLLHDPDRAVKQAEARLARGEAVTLIGESGGPAWWRWCEGGQESQTAAAQDGTFAVHSAASLALVELLRQPRPSRFRLRAEVRHPGSNDWGKVGVYFAHATCPSDGGPVHHYGAMTFNDIRDEKAYWEGKFKGLPGMLPPRGNMVLMGPHLYFLGGTPPPTLPRVEGYFQPHGLGGRWRRLVVEVTPMGVEGSFDGAPVGELPASQWEKHTRDAVAGLRTAQPGLLYAQGLEPVYASGGGLGLYVERGSASFRRVAVEPLGPPN